MAGSRDQDVHVLCKQLHPWKKVPPIGPSPAFPGTVLWWPAHLSRVAQVCTANQRTSGCPPNCREEIRKGMLLCLPQPKGWAVPASLLQGQAEYCAKFYFKQTFESTQAQLAKVYSASLSHVQYFHKRIKSLVLVTGLNTLANFDFNMVQLQFSRSAAYQLGGTMLNSLLNF